MTAGGPGTAGRSSGGDRPMSGPPGRGPGSHGPGGMSMMPVAKPKNFRGSARRLLGALRPEAALIVIVIVLAVVSVTFAIAGPKILGNATNILFEGVVGQQIPGGVTKDQAVAAMRAAGEDKLADMVDSMDVVPGEGVDFEALARTLLVLLGVYLLSAIFGWGQAYLMAGATQRTAYRLRRGVEAKLGRLPLAYFDRHARGDILSRVTNDIDNIAQTLQQSLTQLISGLLTVVGVLIMMFTISPILAVISLLMVPVSVVVTVLIASRSQKQFAAQWDQTGKLNGHVEEMHTGHGIVKVFGHQREAIEAFDAYNVNLYEASFRAQFISGTIQPALMFLGNLNYVAIAVIGGVRVANGQMSLGDVQAFIQYSRQFTMPIVQVASIMNVLQSAVASAERVFELMDEAEEVKETATPVTLAEVAGRVVLDRVSFRYESDTPLIDDLHLAVEPGQTVAIVGPTGAGKTTLVNLLMRFYEIDAGRITIDGVDIQEMSRDGLRRLFGMVLQDAWLFKGTIRENIAYGADGVAEERVLAAARAAHVDHFVRTLPEGYATVIDDEATSVSQGERQLLTIARAFLVDPPILILDEATSSVDTRTEVLIQRAMATLMKGRTSFVIAHRLSTIRDADTILVMNHGRIIEQGTHEELIARGGFYADLYASQFEEGGDELNGTGAAGGTLPAAFARPGHPMAPGVASAAAMVGGSAARGGEVSGERAVAVGGEHRIATSSTAGAGGTPPATPVMAPPAAPGAPPPPGTAEPVPPAPVRSAPMTAAPMPPAALAAAPGTAAPVTGTPAPAPPAFAPPVPVPSRGPGFGWRALLGSTALTAVIAIALTLGVVAALDGGLRDSSTQEDEATTAPAIPPAIDLKRLNERPLPPGDGTSAAPVATAGVPGSSATAPTTTPRPPRKRLTGGS